MMVDVFIMAIAVVGHDKIVLVVTEMDGPSSSTDPNEGNANSVYVEMYLKGLVGHLNAGRGTPLRKKGWRRCSFTNCWTMNRLRGCNGEF